MSSKSLTGVSRVQLKDRVAGKHRSSPAVSSASSLKVPLPPCRVSCPARGRDAPRKESKPTPCTAPHPSLPLCATHQTFSSQKMETRARTLSSFPIHRVSLLHQHKKYLQAPSRRRCTDRRVAPLSCRTAPAAQPFSQKSDYQTCLLR